jgi:hypothetical protein
MDAANARARAGRLGALAGLQAGLIGTLAMLAWLAVSGAWYGRSMWATANLMASTFYGESALHQSFSSTTFSGLALYIVIYGLAAALFGLIADGWGRRFPPVPLGMAFALVWYYLWFGLLWGRINPYLPLYTLEGPMMAGHLIYGALLGRFPVYLRRLRPPQPAAPAAESSPTPAEHV